MPGSLQVAIPSGVLPATLFLSFVEDREYVQLQSVYHDNTIQRSQLAQTARRTFQLAKRLKTSDLNVLKALWDSNGNTVPFSWQHPIDLTNITVCFRMSSWAQSTGILRTDVPNIELAEVA